MEEEYQNRTTVTQTKRVIRPFRLIGLICLLIALGLAITALCSRWWAHAKNEYYYQGLWTNCKKFTREEVQADDNNQLETVRRLVTLCARISPSTAWLVSCIVFVFLSVGVTLVAAICVLISLLFGSRGDKLSQAAGLLALVSIIFICVSLIVFVYFFTETFDQIDTRPDLDIALADRSRKWYFGWGYGCGWASTIFLAGAAVMLLMCRKNDEIYEAEKTYVVDD